MQTAISIATTNSLADITAECPRRERERLLRENGYSETWHLDVEQIHSPKQTWPALTLTLGLNPQRGDVCHGSTAVTTASYVSLL